MVAILKMNMVKRGTYKDTSIFINGIYLPHSNS